MKTVFNKKEECDDDSSNENFSFENNKKNENVEINKKPEIDKVYRFRNTVDMIEIKSYKVSNIEMHEDQDKIKSANCYNQCVIY
jgi:hypothetical protein